MPLSPQLAGIRTDFGFRIPQNSYRAMGNLDTICRLSCLVHENIVAQMGSSVCDAEA